MPSGEQDRIKRQAERTGNPWCLAGFSFSVRGSGFNEATEQVPLGGGPLSHPLTTYHVEPSGCLTLFSPFVEGAVVSCGLFPGAVEVIGHKADEIQAPAGGVGSGENMGGRCFPRGVGGEAA